MYRGSLVPLVTQFRNGEIDNDAFRGPIEWHSERGLHGATLSGPVHCGVTLARARCAEQVNADDAIVRGA